MGCRAGAWRAAAVRGAVAGVVPVIRVLQESLAGATIDRVHGIVNGTTNFILTEMARTGMTFEEALVEAQRLGYAEADPSEDVDGRDAAAKMAILARLAFDTPVHLDQVRYEGIEHIQPDDLAYAEELGLQLKLIGTAERIGRRAVRARASRVPVPAPPAGLGERAVQRGHGRVRGDHRDHDVRAGRRRPADRERRARRRDQRDDPAGLDPADEPGARDRPGRGLGVLPASGRRRRVGRAGARGAGARHTRTCRSSRSCSGASATRRGS